MNIYRDGKAIELTEKEICAIYLLAQMRNIKDEVALKLSEDYNIDLSAANINLNTIALEIHSEIADNDTIWDCEQEVYDKVIEKYLKERGM
jgi:hypothetical protein